MGHAPSFKQKLSRRKVADSARLVQRSRSGMRTRIDVSSSTQEQRNGIYVRLSRSVLNGSCAFGITSLNVSACV